MDDKKFDLISIGDSTIDTFIKIHDASIECDIHHEDCKICVKYGDKIPVDSIAHGVAGNAANVAVGCAKLGLKTAIYTNLGDDDQGKTIKLALEKENVAPDYIKINKDKSSNLSVVLTFQGERTIFVYHQDWHYSLPNIAHSSWVYLTSMSESFVNSNIITEVCNYVDRSKAKLAFSPGTHQLKADIKRYPKPLLKNTTINLKIASFPTKLVERTGAGDAYASGLISALALEEPLEEAMVWGAINAAHVIQKVGTQNGLMTKEELLKCRQKSKDFVSVNF